MLLPLIMFSTVADYMIGRAINNTEVPKHRKGLLIASILINMLLLAFFKYYNFFIDSMEMALAGTGINVASLHLNIVLPVGISFYTFQSMSYTIDIYRRNIKPTQDFIAFATFVTYFPQLVAGPIERASRLIPQFEEKRSFNYANANAGVREILWGVFKKVALADNFAIVVNNVYGDINSASGVELFFATVCFAFQIYCDFSAYSNIARGLSRILGIELMVNFDRPYVAKSISEFWQRWHISLTTWFRDYVYIPLGGNRGGSIRTQCNIIAIFLISGLWHGANWTYVIWGALHSSFYMVEKIFVTFSVKVTPLLGSPKKDAQSIVMSYVGSWFRMLITFLAVTFAWVFFRAINVSEGWEITTKILSDIHFADLEEVIRTYHWVIVGIITLLFIEWLPIHKKHDFDVSRLSKKVRWGACYIMLGMATIIFAASEEADFIYFQF